MTRLGDVLRLATDGLKAAGVVSARLDARLLLARALGVDGAWVFSHPDHVLQSAEAAAFDRLLARRRRREPMSHILGQREFWSMPFKVTADTLDPRPDSETVIEAILEQLPDRRAPLSVLDLGTGSGCLLLALLSELPSATGLGVDISPAALVVAGDNARALGLAGRARLQLGEWGAGLTGPFDIIVANPPYIADGELAGLAPEVRCFEPRLALAGGPDGLAAYRALASQVARLLASSPPAIVAFEVGAGQAPAVSVLLQAAGLAAPTVRRDLGRVERCVIAVR
jgi:release factor glutamine methyltransferase